MKPNFHPNTTTDKGDTYVKHHAKVRSTRSAHSAESTRVVGRKARGLFGLACLSLLALAAFLGSGASTAGAAGACSNEALRDQEGATYLPDCRAYEQVSPLEKGGNDISLVGNLQSPQPVFSNVDGTHVAYTSVGAFAGTKGAFAPNAYAAARGQDDWATTPLTPPVFTTNPVSAVFVLGTTPDLSKQLVVTAVALAPGALEGQWNMYVHDVATDSYELVAAVHNTIPPARQATFVGVSEDGSRWYFEMSEVALESTPAPVYWANSYAYNVYEFSNGQLKLAGVLPDGSASPNGSSAGPVSNNQTETARHAVSPDGSQVYWSTTDNHSGGESQIYLYRNGHSTPVTKAEADGSTRRGVFQQATPDGSQAFLMSVEQLTTDASPSGTDLYRYEAATEHLTDLTPTASSAGVEAVLGVSDDGSYVYFSASGALAPGATAGGHNIYVWHDGSIRLIATAAQALEFDSNAWTSGPWRTSPNGRHFGFLAAGALSGPVAFADTGFKQAYLYDYGSDTLSCASCPSGGAASGDAQLLPKFAEHGAAFPAQRGGDSRNVLDDGRFFFDSPEPLVPGDANGQMDVYEYDNGALSLISSGQSPEPSYFTDASASGHDVFFLTRSQLVGQDKDTLYDLYDARIDGGLTSQNPPPARECEGDSCQGSVTEAPAVSAPVSATFAGPGNVKPNAANRCARTARRAQRISKRATRLRRHARVLSRNTHNRRLANRLHRKAHRLAKRADKLSGSAKRCRRARTNRRTAR